VVVSPRKDYVVPQALRQPKPALIAGQHMRRHPALPASGAFVARHFAQPFSTAFTSRTSHRCPLAKPVHQAHDHLGVGDVKTRAHTAVGTGSYWVFVRVTDHHAVGLLSVVDSPGPG